MRAARSTNDAHDTGVRRRQRRADSPPVRRAPPVSGPPDRPATARPPRLASAPPVAPRPTKRRAEGQWALGYREPLNPNEQSKKDDNPPQRPRPDREHLPRSASTASTRPTCVAASAGWACTPSGPRDTTARTPTTTTSTTRSPVFHDAGPHRRRTVGRAAVARPRQYLPRLRARHR